jgi:HEAT repeat protein
MRLPRFRLRLRIRTLLLLVVLVALALVGLRTYRDEPEAHWLLLKLRYGNVEARRSAATQARQSEVGAMFQNILDGISGPADPRTLGAQWRRRQRRAELLLPALAHATKDPDAGCRANALLALHFLAAVHASESEKRLALRLILAATRDRDDSVRTAAVGSLVGLADRDPGAALNAIRSALADPSVEVRRTAAQELGMLGLIVPETQPAAASILIPLLASQEGSRVRVKAAWAMCHFGADHHRHPAGAGPDVVPALVAALHDPDVDVRRTAAIIFRATTSDAQGREIPSWGRRKDSIIPALEAAITDDDKAVREESALALFALGQRDFVVIELIEQATRDPDRPQKSTFESALKEWQSEREGEDP